MERRKESHWKTIQKKAGGKTKSISKAKEGKQDPLSPGAQSISSPKKILQRPPKGPLNPFTLSDNDQKFHEGEETQEEQEEG